MKSIEKVQSAKLATNEKIRKLSIYKQALDLQSLNSIFIGNFQTCERLLPRYGDYRILVNERQRNVVVAVIAIGTDLINKFPLETFYIILELEP